ncbi:MAG: hypothetical protein ACFFD1_11425 [Candidatus Thorarchaeota archaeon]
MSKKNSEKEIIKEAKKNFCVLHTNRKAYRFCDRCDFAYCKEDLVESWSHNFLQYAFLGEKDNEFEKRYLCIYCEKKVRRRRVAFATFLLILFLLFILAMIYNS